MKKTVDIIMKILIALTMVLAILSLVRPDLIKTFIEWVRQIISVLWNLNYLIVFTSSLIEAFPVLWVVVPWQNILLIVWWFFWEISNWNLVYVVIVACIWAIAWNYVGYWLGKIYWKLF